MTRGSYCKEKKRRLNDTPRKKMDENEMDYPGQKDEIDENIVMLTGNGDNKMVLTRKIERVKAQ